VRPTDRHPDHHHHTEEHSLMCDPAIEQPIIRRRRGKTSQRKRPAEPGRAVWDDQGRIVAQVRGPRVTDEDVEQAAALVRWMPTRTPTPTESGGTQ
jgi:hypothetical protein